jgi:uncharacterized SAM-binding protein YcdF (DUF218 family)
MFYYASKVFWFVVNPSSLILIFMVAGIFQLIRGKHMSSLRWTVLAALCYGVFGLTPVSNLMLMPLEERFPRPELQEGFSPAGVIVLGGAVDPGMDSLRPSSALNEAGERMAETVSLARRFPKARIVFSGGGGTALDLHATESDAAAHFFARMALDAARITYEKRSRNTAENARYTQELIKPRAGEKWLLVTSAYHMPRAMDLFRHEGFDVMAWPVDYRAHRALNLNGFFANPADGLRRTDLAAKEWVGLLGYRVLGQTDNLFPAP